MLFDCFLTELSDCESNDVLMKIGNVSEMRLNGWSIEFDRDGTNPLYQHQKWFTSIAKSCTAAAKWFGWSPLNTTGVLKTTLKGHGQFTLDFGNCWNQGTVNVYLNGDAIASAPVGVKTKTKTQSFTPGSVLEIKDEGENSIVSLNSFTVICNGM